MADPQDDVTFKVAADVAGILTAVEQMNTQFTALFQKFDEFSARVTPALDKTSKASEGLFGKFALGAAVGKLAADATEQAMMLVVHSVEDVITALPKMIESVAEANDHMWVLSKQTGISSEALSEFSYVASQTGASLETISTTIFMMSRNLGKATDEMKAGISRLGLSITTLKHEKPEDAFTQILDKIHKLPTEAQQAQIGMQIFGRQFRQIAQLAGQDIDGLRAKAREMGIDVTEQMAEAGNAFTDSFDTFHKIFQGLESTIGNAFIPSVTKAMNALNDLLLPIVKSIREEIGPELESFAKRAEAAFERALTAMKPLTPLIIDGVKLAMSWFGKFVDLAVAGLDKLNGLIRIVTPTLQAIGAAIREAFAQIQAVETGKWERLQDVFVTLKSAVGFLADEFVLLWKHIGPVVEALGSDIWKEFTKGVYALADGISGLVGDVWDRWQLGVVAIERQISTLVKGVSDLWAILKPGLEIIASDAWKLFASYIKAAESEWALLQTTIALVQPYIYEIIKIFGSPIWETAVSVFHLIASAMRLVNNVIDLIQLGLAKLFTKWADTTKGVNAFKTVLEYLVVPMKGILGWIDKVIDGLSWVINLFNQAIELQTKTQHAPPAPGVPERTNIGGLTAFSAARTGVTREDVKLAKDAAAAAGEASDAFLKWEQSTKKLIEQLTEARAAGADNQTILRMFGDAAVKAQQGAEGVVGGLKAMSTEFKALLPLIERANEKKLLTIAVNFDIAALKDQEGDFDRIIAQSQEILAKAHTQSVDEMIAKTHDAFAEMITARLSWKDKELFAINETEHKEIAALGATAEEYKKQYEIQAQALVDKLAAEHQANQLARAEALRAKADELGALIADPDQLRAELAKELAILNTHYDSIDVSQAAEIQKQIKALGVLPDYYEQVYGAALKVVQQKAIDMRAALDGIFANQTPEQLAARIGSQTEESLKQQLDVEEAYFKAIKDNVHISADDKIAQEKKVLDLRLKYLGITGTRTREQQQNELADARRLTANLQALLLTQTGKDAEYTKKAIKASQDRERQLEHEMGVLARMAPAMAKVVQITQAWAQGWAQLAAAAGNTDKFVNAMSKIAQATSIAAQDTQNLMDAFSSPNVIAQIAAVTKAVFDLGSALYDAFTISKGEDVARRVATNWGIPIGEELGNQIAETAAKAFGGDRTAAQLASMQDIIKEGADAAGVSLEKFAETHFDTLIARLRDVFVLIKNGQLTIAQGQKILDDNFATLATAGTDAFGRISDKIKETIRLNDEFGTKSKAIADFLKTQGESAITGFGAAAADATPYADLKKAIDDAQKAVDALNTDGKQGTEDWKTATQTLAKAQADLAKVSGGAKDELADLGTQAVSVFAAATKSGVPWGDALKQIGPALKTIEDDYAAVGLSADDAALKTLLLQNQIVEKAPKAIDGIAGINQELVALDNLSALTPENFAAIERTATRMYGQIKDAAVSTGASTEEANKAALLPIQQYLHEAEDAAKKYGFALDEATQGEIDASKQAGIWKDEQMSLNDIMISGFSAIIEALGGTIPEAWQKMADAAKTASKDAADAATDAAGTASDASQTAADDATVAWENHLKDVRDAQAKSDKDWQLWAQTAAHAADLASGSIDATVGNSLDDVSQQLANTDWDQWARDAVDAAGAAKDAVDTVSFGSSPGGIKEIPLQLAIAKQAATEFSRHMVAQMTSAKIAATALAGAQWSPMSPSYSGQTARQMANVGGPSVVIQSGAFPISTWSIGSEADLVKKKLAPAVLQAVHGGGKNYEQFETLVRNVRR